MMETTFLPGPWAGCRHRRARLLRKRRRLHHRPVRAFPPAPSIFAILACTFQFVSAAPVLTGRAACREILRIPYPNTEYKQLDPRTYVDGSAELRLMTDWAPNRRIKVEAHYELTGAAGDYRSLDTKLAAASVAPELPGPAAGGTTGDERRLLDLSRTIHRTGRAVVSHRIDRLALRFFPDWGAVTIGREAITWGNGLVFNPHDLFNPFAPGDIERDYKLGDDLVLLETRFAGSSWQLLGVPRRDPATGALRRDRSSLAIRLHRYYNGGEWTFLGAYHYNEWVAGMGLVGNLGSAAWRADLLAVLLEDGELALSAVANLDYSWVWAEKNWYGLVEVYYDSLGHVEPAASLRDPRVVRRIRRGERFTLGQAYLAMSLQVELHPLVNAYVSVITGLDGPSAILQPRLVWDARQNLQFTLGANACAGGSGTEFGGVVDPVSGRRLRSPDSVYLWMKAFF